MSHQIIDKALQSDEFEKIKTLLTGHDFTWFFSNHTVSKTVGLDDKRVDYKFHHVFYEKHAPNSVFIDVISPIIKVLSPLALVTSRAFLSTFTGQKVNHGFHTDHLVEDERSKLMKTAIFYVNTNNGGTLFEDGTFVESIENRLLIFSTSQRHAAITATDVAARVVLNFNYI